MTQEPETKSLSFQELLVAEIPKLNRLARYCLRFSKSPDLNFDDLVQIILLRALEKQHLYEPGTNFSAWIAVMMLNKSRSLIQATKRSKRDIGKTISITGFEGQVRDPRSNAELTILTKEVISAIEKLPAKYREILSLWASGMTYIEMREALPELGNGTVNSRLARARDCLRHDTKHETWSLS